MGEHSNYAGGSLNSDPSTYPFLSFYTGRNTSQLQPPVNGRHNRWPFIGECNVTTAAKAAATKGSSKVPKAKSPKRIKRGLLSKLEKVNKPSSKIVKASRTKRTSLKKTKDIQAPQDATQKPYKSPKPPQVTMMGNAGNGY